MSSRSLGVLTVDLVAKTGGFEQGMSRAARTADQRMAQIERRAKLAGAAIGAALVTGATLVARNVKVAIDRMDEMSKAAQRAQLPTEQFSQLAYAANLADVSMQDITTSFGRLSRAQADAARGGKEQIAAFERLNIAFKNQDGTLRSSREVFLDFADAYRKFQGSPEILATGMQIFGRSFQNLIPLLKDGRSGLESAADEADRLGFTIDTQAGRAAEEFNDNLTRLRTVVQGFWNEVATGMLPQLVEATKGLQRLKNEGDLARNTVTLLTGAFKAGIWIIDQYNNAVDRTSILIGVLTRSAEGLNEVMSNVGIGGLFNEGSVKEGYAKIEAALEDGQRDLDELIKRQNESRTRVQLNFITADSGGIPEYLKLLPPKPIVIEPPDPPTGGTGSGRNEARRAAEEALRAQKEAREELRRQIEAVADAREQFDAFAAQLSGPMAAANYQFAVDQQRLNDLASKGEIAADALAEAQANLRKEFDETSESIRRRLDPAGELLKDLQFENELMRMGNVERELAIALRYADGKATEAQVAAIREQIKANQELAKSIELQDGFRNAFADFFEDVIGGTKSITDAFRDMLDNINRMILRRISENWVEQLFGGQGQSGGGQYGGWLQAIAGMFGGGRASGGWAAPNKIYEVNERGLEMATVNGRDYLLTGGSGANITPAHKVGGGRSVNVTQQFINPVMYDRTSESQRAAEAGRKIREAARNS